MEWSDHGIVLASRPHGETGIVASLLTRSHGRHAGFVPGGVSRRARPVWQPGNLVEVSWRARLAEQLGNFNGELREAHAARERARRAARDAVRDVEGRPSDEELGYYSTGDSFGKIFGDLADEVGEKLSEARHHPAVKRVADLIDGLEGMTSRFGGR